MKNEIENFVEFDNYSNQPLDQSCLEVIDEEPRIKDIYLGERLGMAQPLNIRKVIENNFTELSDYGMVHAQREPYISGTGAKRETTVYRLNEAQAVLVCMLSRTKRAAKVRKELIDLYMAYRYQGTCLVKAHRRVITPPADTGKRDFAPQLDQLSVYMIGDNSICESARSGEVVITAPVEGYAQAGLYAIRRMDGSIENFRCCATADGKEIILAKDNATNCAQRIKRSDFDRLELQKIIAVFKCLEMSTGSYNQLRDLLLQPVKRKSLQKYLPATL